jgi:hypothetical protein
MSLKKNVSLFERRLEENYVRVSSIFEKRQKRIDRSTKLEAHRNGQKIASVGIHRKVKTSNRQNNENKTSRGKSTVFILA